MTRAAVLIGVNRSGTLPVLENAVRSAHAMEAWALGQGMRRDRVKLLTDENEPVSAEAVKRAIRALVDKGAIEQLVVYFAGHGVNILYGEQWLLSDAPVDTQAAVNVEGSVVAARRCGIPHVVFVSDACRTAAEGIQAQAVRGSEAFPNLPGSGPESAVDLFFACTLGRPAFEVRDPAESTAAYKALYTRVFIDALEGRFAEILEAPSAEQDARSVIRPRPLKRLLPGELSRALTRLKLAATIGQVPDARITSDDDAWLAQVAVAPPVERLHRGGDDVEPPQPRDVAGELVFRVLRDSWPNVESEAQRVASQPGAVAAELVRGMRLSAQDFGPAYVETQCAIKVRGAEVAEAICARPSAVARSEAFSTITIDIAQQPAATMLVVLKNGGSALLPALRGFIAALTFEGRELVDVVYMPSQNSTLWSEHGRETYALGAVRAAIAAAARLGLFHPETDDACELHRRITGAHSTVPTLALHGAYAFHDRRLAECLREADNQLREQLGMSFFDVGLLAGAFRDGTPSRSYFPAVPMLSHGWAVLRASSHALPGWLAELHLHVAPSFWTCFTPRGTELLKRLMTSGTIS
jgi:hypothetical protein